MPLLYFPLFHSWMRFAECDSHLVSGNSFARSKSGPRPRCWFRSSNSLPHDTEGSCSQRARPCRIHKAEGYLSNHKLLSDKTKRVTSASMQLTSNVGVLVVLACKVLEDWAKSVPVSLASYRPAGARSRNSSLQLGMKQNL